MSSCGKNIVNQERVPIYGVIFDMDGTLTVPVLNFKMLREKLGIAGRKVDILQHIEDAPNATEKENRKKMVEDFEDEGDRLLQFQPNLHQLFYFLKKNNVKRALLTRNKQSAVDSFISKFIQEDDKGIFTDKNEIFSEILTRDFKPVKPHPAPIQHICQQWDVPCENTLMVGDDIQDIASGKAAGSVTVRKIKSDTKDVEWKENLTIDNLGELTKILETSFDVSDN